MTATTAHNDAEWWINRNEDGGWTAAGHNRTAAILYGIIEFDSSPFYLMQAETGTLNTQLFNGDIAEIIDNANEDAADGDGDPVTAAMKDTDLAELEERLNAVVKRWAKEKGETTGIWAFGWTGPQEFINFGADGLAQAIRSIDAPEEVEELIHAVGRSWENEERYAATIRGLADRMRDKSKAASARRAEEFRTRMAAEDAATVAPGTAST